MKKKLLSTILALVLVCSCLTACGGGAGESTNSSGKIELSLWSTYTEASNLKLTELVQKFNAESDKYEVRMEIGQNASGNRQKLAASTQEYFPSLFMGTNNAIVEYAQSEYTMPIQQYIDKDSEDWTANILGAVRTGFSDDKGTLIGVPVGTSVKGYMVNVDYLTAAGYTLSEEELSSLLEQLNATTTSNDETTAADNTTLEGDTTAIQETTAAE